MDSLVSGDGSAEAPAAADAPEYGGAADTRGVRCADGNGGGAVADAGGEAHSKADRKAQL